MAITRLDLASDATWSRAWIIDTLAELAAFALTYVVPAGPKRGDVVVCNEDSRVYIFTGNNTFFAISGLANLPIDLNADVISVLPTANGGTSVDIASAALPLGSGQIQFPGIQNPSGNVNTLDDYEEGTWTPSLGGSGGQSGQVYTTQSGQYRKIGSQVTVWFNVVLSTLGTITGASEIQGLPFTLGASSIGAFQWVGLNTTWVYIQVVGFNATTIARLRGAKIAAVSNSDALVQADFTNTSNLFGVMTYFV